MFIQSNALEDAMLVKKLKKGIQYPHLFGRKANQLFHTRLGLRQGNPTGLSVVDEDWDNLIILDACRYDVFRNHVDLPGKTKQKVSKGSATSEFIVENFKNRDLSDTIVITGNSWYFKLDREYDFGFFKIIQQGTNIDIKDRPDYIAKKNQRSG